MQTPNRRHWQRYLRLTLRSLIDLILLVGAGLGWIIRRAHIQRDAVHAIEKIGGSVWYDHQTSLTGLASSDLAWPKWLIDHVGVAYLELRRFRCELIRFTTPVRKRPSLRSASRRVRGL
jgi:hypothetical protein